MDVLGFLRSLGPYQPMATIVSLAISALIGFKALRRTDVREHHRWLQEKRREAYVDFLSEARKAYRTISDPEPEAGSEHRDALVRDEDDVNYALDVLRIVGPRSMAAAGEHVVAGSSWTACSIHRPATSSCSTPRTSTYRGRTRLATPPSPAASRSSTAPTRSIRQDT